MNANLFFKATILTIVAFLVSYGFYQLSGNVFTHSLPQHQLMHTDKLQYKEVTQQISLTGVDTLIINSPRADISISQNNKDMGIIEFHSGSDQKNALVVEKSNHSLLVKLPEAKDYPDSWIKLAIPKNIKTININAELADIKMTDIDLDRLVINTRVGDIQLDKVNVNDSILDTVDGDVRWNGNVKKLKLLSVSGDVIINSNFTQPDYDIKSVSGDVILSFSKPINTKVDVQSSSGAVRINNKYPLSVSKESNTTIRVRTVSGDIQVK